MRGRGTISAGLSMIVLATAVATAQQGAVGGAVAMVQRRSGESRSTRRSIRSTKSNVSRLRIAWRRPAVDVSLVATNAGPRVLPRFPRDAADDRRRPLRPNGIGLVEAFHPATGKTLWVQQPFADEPQQGLAGDSTRGVAYWTEGVEQRLFVIRGEYLIALDPRTGRADRHVGRRAAG